MGTERKTVVITGASQGIGAGIVNKYRAADWYVVANSRTIDRNTFGGDPDIVAVEGDIADPATAERIVQAALRAFGRIDSLVNNAGIFIAKPFVEYTEADLALKFAVNVAGFFHITQRVVAQLLRQGSGGHIVSITTALVDQPISGVPSVLASLTKGSIAAATRSLAIEYAERGIRVNAVAPGVIKTPMHPEATHAALAALHPMKRMGTIEEVVEAVLYLERAGFVTGETLHIDGGQHAGHW